MAEANGTRRVSRPYANAREVLPPDLYRTVQEHFTGLMWIPAETRFYAVRRKLVLALKDQGVSTGEIAELASVTTRRARQILAGPTLEKRPHPSAAHYRRSALH